MCMLDKLGPRICILGPSNSGKSTLADAVARKLNLPVVHLDQLFHQPHTNWVPRPETEFLHLHDLAIRQEQWVIEGNYTRCIAQRLAHATGFILLDVSTVSSLVRYFRRCWFERERRGALIGSMDSVKWKMIHHITVVTPPNRKRYAQLFAHISLPKLRLATINELHRFYLAEGLQR